MSNFTLQDLYTSFVEMCMPAQLRSQKKKLKFIEDLNCNKAVHNLKIADLNKKVAVCRAEARNFLKSKTKNETSEAAARQKLYEARRCISAISKHQQFIAMIEETILNLDMEASAFQTAELLDSAHRTFGSDAKTVDAIDNAMDRLREGQESARYIQDALTFGTNTDAQEDLERELQMLIDDVATESAMVLPSLPAAPPAIPAGETHVIGTPIPVSAHSEHGVVRRGAPGPDNAPIAV